MTENIDIKLLLNRRGFALDVDLCLPAQGITVLFGPSGSGKTTLLRCLAGLEQAHGRIQIGEQTWQDSERGVFIPTWQRSLGYVFQEASLLAHLSVEQNLRFGIKRIKNSKTAEALNEAIALLGIGHLLQRDPDRLSGGERQRVAIARALAMQPHLLLLDEPLASLDQARREEILPWLERLHTSLEIPVLYVTHAMQELTRLADHVVVLQDGEVRLQGATANVLAEPAFAASLGGQAGVVLQATVVGHDDPYHLTQLALPAGHLWVAQSELSHAQTVRLHVHASDVSLTLTEPKDTSIQNRLRGTIESINADAHPAHRIVTVSCGEQHLLARVTARALQSMGVSVGSCVWCQIKSVALVGH